MRNCTIVLALFAAAALALGAVARADLVGYWSFDNAGNRYEESSGWAQSAKGLAAGHYDAEDAVGTPVWSSTNGIIGTYLDLSDAEDDALRVKNSVSWPIPSEGATFGFGHGTAEPQTVTVWVKGWPDADDETFVGYSPLRQGNHGYSLRRGTATLAEYTYGNRVIQGNAGATLADGEWHHLAGVVDPSLGSSSVKLYVDGQLAANNSLGAKWDYDADYLLFGAMSTGGAPNGFSNVLLDDIGVWHGDSSPKEIAAMHAMGLFEAIGLNDPGVANLVNAFDTAGSTTINGNSWAYTDLSLTSTIMGDTGGTAGTDAWVVLNANGFGMQITAAPEPVVPEPSTFALAALGLLGLVGWRWRRRR